MSEVDLTAGIPDDPAEARRELRKVWRQVIEASREGIPETNEPAAAESCDGPIGSAAGGGAPSGSTGVDSPGSAGSRNADEYQ